MQRELGDILRSVKDPRVQDAFVSVTRVECAPDLKTAKVYYSVMDAEMQTQVRSGLKSAQGFIRRELAQRMNLRMTPELFFQYDTSISYGAHISSILQRVGEELKEADARDAAEEAERLRLMEESESSEDHSVSQASREDG